MKKRAIVLLAAAAAISCNGGGSSSEAPPAASAAAAHAKPTGAEAPATTVVEAMLETERKLAADILVGGQTMKTLTELTDAYGPRLTGGEVHRGAAAWAADRFRAYGVDAALEPFTFEHEWTRGEARGKVIAPSEHALHVVAYAFTPATPDGVRGEIVKLEDDDPDAIAKRKDEIKGKIAYLAGTRGARRRRGPVSPAWAAAQAGAIAVLTKGDKPADALYGAMCRGPKRATCTFPEFMVGLEDAAMIDRLLEKGAVSVELASTGTMGGAVQVPNVIAEIKGREKPDEIVMLGAHLDSWDLGSGAQDNGSGSAQVLEAARALYALGTPPRRTVRFALWGGEEQGILGSAAYVKAHANELDRVVAYLNTDYGAGAPIGWDLDGREDVMDAMKPIAKILAPLGGGALQTKIRCDTDHCPFWVQGVPTWNLDVDTSHYDEVHHLATDTVDKVKEASLASGAAVLATTAYVLAELPDRIAPRIDHATVAKHLKGSDALPWMIAGGLWKP